MTTRDRSIETLTIALADRYRIERELGAGGMATVYLATDVKHDRQVALKVLRAELALRAVGARVTQRGGFEHGTPRRRRRQPWLMRYTDQPFSVVDAVSFAIMAERGTRAALTLDRHFAIAGFQMVTDLASTPTGAA